MSPASDITSLLSSKLSGLFFDEKNNEEPEEEEKKSPVAKENKAKEERLPEKEEERKPKSRKKLDAIREESRQWDPLSEFDRLLEMLDSVDPEARDEGMKILDGVVDEDKVACVAIFSKNKDARAAALERVERNPELLSVIYSESQFKDTSEAALDNLVSMLDNMANPSGLVVIACNHHDREKRLKAVRGLKEADALLEVAYESRYEDGRWEAIESLKDMDIVIAKDDLRNDETLEGLVDSLVKSTATEGDVIGYMKIVLENVRYLDGFARRKDEFDDIVKDNLVSYYKMLRGIATSSRHPKARDIALEALSGDADKLAEVVQHAEYEETSNKAVELLSQCLNREADPQAFALVAALAKDADKRAKALDRIEIEEMLRYVVKFSRFDDSRNSAIRKLSSRSATLSDLESLRMVIAYTNDSKNRLTAEKRVSELKFKDREAAKKRDIKDIENIPSKPQVHTEEDEDEEREGGEKPEEPQENEQKKSAQQELMKENMKRKREPEPDMEPYRPENRTGLMALLKELIGF